MTRNADYAVGEIIGFDFDDGFIIKVRLPDDARVGHWWISLAPVTPPPNGRSEGVDDAR